MIPRLNKPHACTITATERLFPFSALDSSNYPHVTPSLTGSPCRLNQQGFYFYLFPVQLARQVAVDRSQPEYRGNPRSRPIRPSKSFLSVYTSRGFRPYRPEALAQDSVFVRTLATRGVPAHTLLFSFQPSFSVA